MKPLFFNSTPTPQDQTPTEQAQPPSGSRKKTYAAIAAIFIVVILAAAIFFVPQSRADTIDLGVHYTEGEKLTYNVNIALSSASSGTSANVSADATVTIEVISIQEDTYTLNYTTTANAQGYAASTSKLLEVKESQMVTTLALLPVALQQFATIDNQSTPLVTAVFDKTTAKVGDTWSIPVDTIDPSSTMKASNLTVTFKAIQDLSVPAGNYRVFRIDLDTSMEGSESNDFLSGDLSVQLSGQSYLETGSCKQIQSNLLLVMSMSAHFGSSDIDYALSCSITSTLVSDVKA